MDTVETPARLEPCQLRHYSARLADVTSAITGRAATLGSKLHPVTARSLADLVRVQLEARAYIEVQRSVDARFAAGTLGELAEQSFVSWLHAEFYGRVPPELARI